MTAWTGKVWQRRAVAAVPSVFENPLYPQNAKKHDGEPGQLVWSLGPVLDGVEEVELLSASGDRVASGSGRGYRLEARVDIVKDCIRVHNAATRQLPMKKWTLQGPGGVAFAFPDNFVLKTGATVTVWCGEVCASRLIGGVLVCMSSSCCSGRLITSSAAHGAVLDHGCCVCQ